MNNTEFFTPDDKSKISLKKSNIGESSRKVGGMFKKLGAGVGIVGGIGLVIVIAVYFVAIKPAYSLLTNINTLKKDAKNVQMAMTNRDLVALAQYLDETEADLETLKVDRDNNVGWAKKFGFTKRYYDDSEYFINAGLQVIDAGREAIVLIEPFADAGGFKISEDQEVVQTGLAEAFSTWIGIMPEIAQDSDVVLEKLVLAGEELAKVDASRYPESFRGQPIRALIIGAQNTLTQLNDSAPDIKEALTIIPPLLGVDGGEKRYMIMFLNDKEIRATGGFFTYFSTFKLNNALLTSDFTSFGSYNIDFVLETIDPYYTFPKVPAAYENYLKVERMFARDTNISPDLPTSIDQFLVFWDLAMPLYSEFKPVDGVFTIDTVVLEELLEVTGPVTLNGITYDSETVTLELEKLASLTLREQANRKKVLGDLMEQMLVNVFESDSNLWPKLVEKGIDLANRKHVQGWVFDERAQVLLEKYNFGGRIVDPVEGDYAYVVSTNLGGGKTNGWFVNKEVTHALEREGDRWVRTVDAKFVYNESGPNGNGQYDVFKTRYQDWVRLYVPLGAELIGVEGSNDPAGEGTERNKTYFDGYLTLAPGETKTISFKYYLPDGVVGSDSYDLYLQKQSGIDVEIHNVVVNGKSTMVELSTDEEYSSVL